MPGAGLPASSRADLWCTRHRMMFMHLAAHHIHASGSTIYVPSLHALRPSSNSSQCLQHGALDASCVDHNTGSSSLESTQYAVAIASHSVAPQVLAHTLHLEKLPDCMQLNHHARQCVPPPPQLGAVHGMDSAGCNPQAGSLVSPGMMHTHIMQAVPFQARPPPASGQRC